MLSMIDFFPDWTGKYLEVDQDFYIYFFPGLSIVEFKSYSMVRIWLLCRFPHKFITWTFGMVLLILMVSHGPHLFV